MLHTLGGRRPFKVNQAEAEVSDPISIAAGSREGGPALLYLKFQNSQRAYSSKPLSSTLNFYHHPWGTSCINLRTKQHTSQRHFNCPDELYSLRAEEVRETFVEKKGRPSSQCSQAQRSLSYLGGSGVKLTEE